MDINSIDQQKIGVLLTNTGSPLSYEIQDVKRYLHQFLMDERVIDRPALFRWLLVHGIIVPLRAARTSKAYQSVWLSESSPLLYHTQKFASHLQASLGTNYQVVIGMRYSQPSIEEAITKLIDSHCKEIIIFPLYPQYSSAATASAVEETWRVLAQFQTIPATKVIPAFYNDPGFIASYTHLIQQYLEKVSYDYLLFSYHGLPERHVVKSEVDSQVCDKKGPCPSISYKNSYCYRAQCYETTRLIAKILQLNEQKHGVSFQSRLGVTPWIKPYTDEIFKTLRQQGIQDLAIVCPSFTSDCLETLEEIGIRAKAQWLALGGNSLTLVPCLNDQLKWVETAKNLIIQ